MAKKPVKLSAGGVPLKDELGQVFTPTHIVDEMLSLWMNRGGSVLEPSCGDGAFAERIFKECGPNLFAVELDDEHRPSYVQDAVKDFFDLPDSRKFDVVIGNPPYVDASTLKKELPELHAKLAAKRKELFDGRTNLYLFFIEKCAGHLNDEGELIFITPREWLKSTSAAKLNEILHEQGKLTYLRETGDEKIFRKADIPCVIFRWSKGWVRSRTRADGRVQRLHEGMFTFLERGDEGEPLSDFFTVSVGGISGAEEIYANNAGNMDFVFSETRATGLTQRMFHGDDDAVKAYLAPHKKELLGRGVRKFTDKNWWEWGRGWRESKAARVYVNMKTRTRDPFFTHSCRNYDGSVLALFPKETMDVRKAAKALNETDWDMLGFMAGKRFMFGQKSLSHALIPTKTADALRAAMKMKDPNRIGSKGGASQKTKSQK